MDASSLHNSVEDTMEGSQYPDPDHVRAYPWTANDHSGSWDGRLQDDYSLSGPMVHEGFISTDTQAELGHDKYHELRINRVNCPPPIQQAWRSQNGDGQDFTEVIAEQRDDAIDLDLDYTEANHLSEDELISEADSDIESHEPIPPPNPGRRGRSQRGRGAGGGRGSSRGRGRGRGRGRQRKGDGQRGGIKGKKFGTRKPLEPSHDFKVLHSQASMAFIDQDYDRAEEIVSQAILLNPEIFTAHSLLSEIHLARGDKERALTALFHGAHTRPRDGEVWSTVAELIIERSGDDRALAISDAVYCYNRVLGADPNNLNARYRRAALNREIGKTGKAAHDYMKLLERSPHDTAVLRHLAEVFLELGQTAKAITYYDDSFGRYRATEPQMLTSFNWSDANIYAELFLHAQQYNEGLIKVKRLSRWLLGRGDDCFWDDFHEDDREYDAKAIPRRAVMEGYESDKHNELRYGTGLPLELRIKLGFFRLNQGSEHLEEALLHFCWLNPGAGTDESKIDDFPDLFLDVAEALRIHGHYEEALRFYEPIHQIEEYADAAYFGNMALCYHALRMYDEAEQCYTVILDNDSSDMVTREKIAKMFGKANMPHRAAPYVEELAIGRRERLKAKKADILSISEVISGNNGMRCKLPIEEAQAIPTILAGEKAPKPAPRSRKQTHINGDFDDEDVRTVFVHMDESQSGCRAGEPTARQEWMSSARLAISYFQAQRIFFPLDKHTKFFGYSREARERSRRSKLAQDLWDKEVQTGRLDQSTAVLPDEDLMIPDHFCNISFARWLDVFLEYALMLALDEQLRQAYTTIVAASDANIFYHSEEAMFLINVIWSACALIGNDAETLCTVSRYFMKEHQFESDSYLMYSALNRLCGKPNLCFGAGLNQKFILRQIKAMDFSISGQDRSRTEFTGRARFTKKDEDGNPVPAARMNIVLLLLYGQMIYTGGSFIEALNYFYRAYALEPEHPLVNLSLALSYMQYALKRQSENRQYLMMQGLSFLFAYYDRRSSSPKLAERQEAEYNVARTYHMIGLTHLAIPFYERCLVLGLAIEATPIEAEENFTEEAAYALQGIWAANGEMKAAQDVTEKWLVL